MAPAIIHDELPAGQTKKLEEIYQKKTQLEHILLRPDTYIGSVEATTQQMWVLDPDTRKMVFRQICFVPGLYKIFDEILVNAADNKIRDPSMNTIRVDVDLSANRVSVYNNGKGIPVEIHSTEKVYVPELIFGHLLTSSNYDDQERKVTGGRNGYGAKLCNIFSKEFSIETSDSKKKFTQIFTSNMSIKGNPLVTKAAKGEEYTRISFIPDLQKFSLQNIDNDHLSLFYKRAYDLAGTVKNVKVFLNGEKINIKGFKQYAEMYSVNSEDQQELPQVAPIYEAINDRWEICVTASDGQFQQVSFVNSIYTFKGGTHVNYVVDQLTSSLSEIVKKKNKTAQFKPFQIKNHIWIFINCLIENPAFDSQTKENMTLRASSFGSKCELTEDFVKKVLKTGIVDSILSWVKSKQDKELKKTDGHKSSRLSGIPKLDDANFAGTRQADRCTLILTEGDSAKALAVSGLSVVGRDHYGVFPLRGKLLNVRDAAHKQIMENAEISQVKQILGLQHGKVYTSTDSLRYGHVMIMTDQDHDGSHIKGLLINFLDHFWPSLLRLPGFLTEFITPIVKATKGRQEVVFYTIPEYERWKEARGDSHRSFTIKYYKGVQLFQIFSLIGLGTSTAADAKKYFSSMGSHMKEFGIMSEQERTLIDMAFSKKKADERKDWLKGFTPGTFIDHSRSKISYDDFVQKELILFSMADNIRSIPSIADGLKPGLRKILFGCFKRRLIKSEIKVAQLAGYISEHSAYHHGDQSLCACIVGMAQDFVGSNNVNLLFPSGQFGTRIQGGKDAASPRYVFTRLSTITRHIFIEDDDHLLTHLYDDGQRIEPEWYAPIIPMVLVNGSEGIGTGWSTMIPNFSPIHIIKNLQRKLDGLPYHKMHPWYKGFRGHIEEISAEKYRICGRIQKIDPETLHITELPIGMWTQTYKEFLEGLLAGGDKGPSFIKDFKEYHTDTAVSFIVKLSPEMVSAAEGEDLIKKFKLSTAITLSNMVAFDRNLNLRRYVSAEQILDDFYDVRLEYYQKRKAYLTEKLQFEWNKLDMKMRFIKEIIDGKLVITKKKRSQIMQELRSRGYTPGSKTDISAGTMLESKDVADEEKDSDEDAPNLDSEDRSSSDYDYLLGMPLWSLTYERMASLSAEKEGKEKELEALLSRSPKDLWEQDLAALLEILEADPDYCHEIPMYESTSDSQCNLSGSGVSSGNVRNNNKKADGHVTVQPPFTIKDEFEEMDSNKSGKKGVKKNKKTVSTLDSFLGEKRLQDKSSDAPCPPVSSLPSSAASEQSLAQRIQMMLSSSGTKSATTDGHRNLDDSIGNDYKVDDHENIGNYDGENGKGDSTRLGYRLKGKNIKRTAIRNNKNGDLDPANNATRYKKPKDGPLKNDETKNLVSDDGDNGVDDPDGGVSRSQPSGGARVAGKRLSKKTKIASISFSSEEDAADDDPIFDGDYGESD